MNPFGAMGNSSAEMFGLASAEKPNDPEKDAEDGTDESDEELQEEEEEEAPALPAPSPQRASKFRDSITPKKVSRTASLDAVSDPRLPLSSRFFFQALAVVGGVGKKPARRSITKPKNKTPKAKTPTEMKNPRTHFSAKINQLEKAITKARDFEERAEEQCLKHRNVLTQSDEKCAKAFLSLKLSQFIIERRDELKECVYTDEDGIETSLAHDVAQLLRGLADLVDTRNAEVEALEAELEAKKKEFAEWQMKDLMAKTGLSLADLKSMM